MVNRIFQLVFVLAGGLPLANHLPAQVIYSGPQNVVIDAADELPHGVPFRIAPNIFKIDFNLDGKPDIVLFRSTTNNVSDIGLGRLNGAGYAFYPGVHLPSPTDSYFLATPWWKGDLIDSAAQWHGDDIFPLIINFGSESIPHPPATGLFDPSGGYIGVRLIAADGPHYGWIQYASDTTGSRGIVYDWAWETAPNVPIIAGDVGLPAVPEPGTYALAGVAVLGLSVLYRRRN